MAKKDEEGKTGAGKADVLPAAGSPGGPYPNTKAARVPTEEAIEERRAAEEAKAEAAKAAPPAGPQPIPVTIVEAPKAAPKAGEKKK